MNRIISFSEVSDTLEIVPPLDTPNRCAYVKVATENNGTSTPNSPINRLIWRVAKNTTYYTVTWVFNDGVTPDKVETNVPQGTSVNSATAGKPATDPTRANYDFAGWYIGNDPLDNQTVSGNTTVTAHWTPLYTITWDANGGSWSNGDIVRYSQNVPSGSSISSYKPSPDPTKVDNTFDDWYINGTVLTNQTISGDVTLVAHWDLTPVTTYTIRFMKSDGQTEAYPSVQYVAGSAITIPSQGSESDNYAATLINPDPDLYYTPTGWGLSTDVNVKLGQLIKYANGDYTFISTFNGDTRNDGNIKIFDQIGQLLNTTKTKPADKKQTGKSGDIGGFQSQSLTGWFSMVHDGHSSSGSNPDVLGSDKGISPSESERLRVYPSASGRHAVDGFYSYAGDSIVYENLDLSTQTYTADHAISGFKTSDSNVTSNDLLTEITFKDSNNNVVLHIKVNDEHKNWLKFAIIDVRGAYTNTKFLDMENYNPSTYVEKLYPVSGANTLQVDNIPLQAEIQYYIKDNTGNARCGQIDVETPQGGNCSYVTNTTNTVFNSSNDKYMTKGTVFFYQLGPDYTGKPA